MKFFFQELRSISLRALCHFFGCTARKEFSPALTAFWSHIYDIVCHFDNVKIMLDNNDRIALIDQLVQHIHQHADILKVQSGGRLIKNIERLACIPFGKFGGKLHTLAFATGKPALVYDYHRSSASR